MTDLEMTKLCAEAMGFVGKPVVDDKTTMWTTDGWEIAKSGLVIEDRQHTLYNPLHDDSQAMSLVRKLKVWLSPGYTKGEKPFEVVCMWAAAVMGDYDDNGPSQWISNTDINRAIVECVAAMKASRSTREERWPTSS